MSEKTYRITRFYQDGNKDNRTIKTGLTLEEAQEWCKDPETNSRTATLPDNTKHTEQHGPWFDGYNEE